MATGYTDQIKDGIDFKTFALSCARAFGACINQRDEDSSIPPKKQEPSTYNLDRLKTLNEKLENFKKYTNEQFESLITKEYNEDIERRTNNIKESKELKIKYEQMLNNVNNWTPPTEEHNELKNFMADQIKESIIWDCDIDYHTKTLKNIKKLTVEEYKKQQLDMINNEIKYHEKEHLLELKRTKDRNDWIDSLYNSLN